MSMNTSNRILVAVAALVALPAYGTSQKPSNDLRGCPPPPIGEVTAIADSVPVLAGASAEITFVAPEEGWEMGRISWVAVDQSGSIYVFHRGEKADPIVVVNREGRVLRSWGKGLFSVPHSLRIDAKGNVWTTDAQTSTVRKFSADGRPLLAIEVGDVPGACDWPTRGTTDVAFAPNGHVYVADGYTNARIVEFSPEGRKVREWGARGDGRSEFVLPHSIAIDDNGTVHVADRENGRIQRFSLDGQWVGQTFVGGKPFTIAVTPDGMWVDVRVLNSAKRPQATLVRLKQDGTVTGRMIAPGGHGSVALPGGRQLLVPSGNKLFLVSSAP